MSEKNNGRAVVPGATARGRARFRSTKQKPHGKAPAPGRLAVIAGASLLLLACCAGVSALVVQPVLDITPEIQSDIARRMQEEP